jgi:hypothetical protein
VRYVGYLWRSTPEFLGSIALGLRRRSRCSVQAGDLEARMVTQAVTQRRVAPRLRLDRSSTISHITNENWRLRAPLDATESA